MSFKEQESNPNEVYFTPQSKIDAMARRGELELDIVQRESEYVYDTDEGSNVPSSNSSYTHDEHVLPLQDRTTNDNTTQPTMRLPRATKQVVQDIYDEDHYCLARNSGCLTDGPLNSTERADGHYARIKFNTPKRGMLKTIMIILGIVFIISTISGIAAYLMISRQGI